MPALSSLSPFRLPPGARLSLFYAALFTVVGVQLPYWPLWLQAQEVTPGQIGILLAVGFWAKVLANPLIGRAVDVYGRRRGPMIVLATVALLAYALFAVADGFPALLALSIVSTAAFAALMPLGENVTLLTAYEKRLDYGRIRLWGSLTFIGGSLLGGRLLLDLPVDVILWAILGGLGLTIGACVLLPDVRTRSAADRAPPPPLAPLLRQPAVITFLAAAALLQASHAAYYGFATLHWRAAGLSEALIGVLWAIGVVAEIVLFAFGNRVVERFGPARLLLLGGAGGALRWSVLALTTSPWLVAPVQTLHALTFGAIHLGAMHFIARAVPPECSGRVQAIYSSVALGAGMGLAMGLTGRLFETGGGTAAFAAMAGLSVAGMAVARLLAARWTGGRLPVTSK